MLYTGYVHRKPDITHCAFDFTMRLQRARILVDHDRTRLASDEQLSSRNFCRQIGRGVVGVVVGVVFVVVVVGCWLLVVCCLLFVLWCVFVVCCVLCAVCWCCCCWCCLVLDVCCL